MKLLKDIAIGILGTIVLIVSFGLAAAIVRPLFPERPELSTVLFFALGCMLVWLLIEKVGCYFYFGYRKIAGADSRSDQLQESKQANRRNWIIVVVAAAFPISILYDVKPIPIFGLAGHHTVYDYHTTSFERKLRWDMRMCDDGECLLKEDRRCGFTLKKDALDSVSTCFYAESNNSDAWTRIDALRKKCGRRFMVFDANVSTFTTDENVLQLQSDCEALGGEWGKPKYPIR